MAGSSAGAVFASNEQDLNGLIESAGLDLIEFKMVAEQRLTKLLQQRVKVRDLIQMSVHLEQLQRAGVPLMESLAEVRDSTEVPRLRDALAQITRDVNEGVSLSAAFGPASQTVWSCLSVAGCGRRTDRSDGRGLQPACRASEMDRRNVGQGKEGDALSRLLAVVVTAWLCS